MDHKGVNCPMQNSIFGLQSNLIYVCVLKSPNAFLNFFILSNIHYKGGGEMYHFSKPVTFFFLVKKIRKIKH